MRSEFAAVAVAGVVMGGALLGASDASAETLRTDASRGTVQIDGITAGWIQSVEGGGATSDGVTNKIGPDHIVHKPSVKYEDITLSVNAGMAKNFYEWIKSSFDHKHVRKNGAVTSFDDQLKITSVIDFKQALITEVGFPALDAASKNASKLQLSFGPEYTRNVPKPGSGPKSATRKADQDLWLPASFRFDYPGCGDPCKQALKISMATVKLGAPPAAGQPEAPHRISNVVVTMPPPQDLMKWAADGSVREGTLEYRAADGSVVYAFRMNKMKPVRVTVQARANKPEVEIEIQSLSVDWTAK